MKKKISTLLFFVVLAISAVSSTSFAFGWKKKVAATLRIKTEAKDWTDAHYEDGPLGPSCVTDIESIQYDSQNWSGPAYSCEVTYYARSRDPQKPKNRLLKLEATVYLEGNTKYFSLGPDFDFGIFNIFTGGISEIFIQTPLNAIKGDIERGVNNFRNKKSPAMNIVQPMAMLICDIEAARLTRRACPEAKEYLKGQYDNRVSQTYAAFLSSLGVSSSVILR